MRRIRRAALSWLDLRLFLFRSRHRLMQRALCCVGLHLWTAGQYNDWCDTCQTPRPSR